MHTALILWLQTADCNFQRAIYLPQLVGAEANLKSKATLIKVDRYLKLANSQMVKSLLGYVFTTCVPVHVKVSCNYFHSLVT